MTIEPEGSLVGATIRADTESNPNTATEIASVESTMRASTVFLVALFLLVSTVCPHTTAAQTPDASLPASRSEDEKRAMLERVVVNQKKNDEAESIYEPIERKETG